MSLTLIQGPATPVVSLADAKAYLRVEHNDEDDTISALVDAVTQHLEGRDGWLGRAFVTQTWELTIDQFPDCEMRIPLPPLQSVTSVKYDDPNGNEQTLAGSEYTVDTASVPGWIVPNLNTRWPTTLQAINSVRVRFVCGYQAAANVPAPIKVAIKRMVATHYAQRETVVIGQTAVIIPGAAEALLAPYRVW